MVYVYNDLLTLLDVNGPLIIKQPFEYINCLASPICEEREIRYIQRKQRPSSVYLLHAQYRQQPNLNHTPRFMIMTHGNEEKQLASL